MSVILLWLKFARLGLDQIYYCISGIVVILWVISLQITITIL